MIVVTTGTDIYMIMNDPELDTGFKKGAAIGVKITGNLAQLGVGLGAAELSVGPQVVFVIPAGLGLIAAIERIEDGIIENFIKDDKDDR